ncbi:MAG: T9SS type A sorting domain-containing protein [Ginsengibacter sp.]
MKPKFLFKRSILIALQCFFLNILFAQHTFVIPDDCTMQMRSMTFRAYIDGSDYIHVLGNKVWYVHRNFQLPGKWDGANEPTYINGNVWFPDWSGDISDKYTLLNPPLASPIISDVTIEKISGRGPVTLTQFPDADNNYEAIILADDDPPGGPDWYEFKLKWMACLPVVKSFTLINADTDKDIQLIEDGSTIDINTLPTSNLNIRANTNSVKPGSVIFILDGKQVRTEEGAPFALAGDLPTGDYHAWTLPIGEHTLTAIPYERSNGGGLKGKSLTIHFNVIANTAFCASSNSSNCPVPFDISVAKSELRNGGAGLSWNPINGGDIQLEIANEDFTDRYDTIFPNVRKNQFFSAIPFGATTAADPNHKFANGLYHWRIRLKCSKSGPWSSWICGPDFSIPYGAQNSMSRPANNSSGAVQKSNINDQPDLKKVTDKLNILKNSLALNINPNPGGNILNISAKGLPSKDRSTIFILSVSGAVIKTIEAKSLSDLRLDISSLRAGTYFIKVITGDKILHKSFVKL